MNINNIFFFIILIIIIKIILYYSNQSDFETKINYINKILGYNFSSKTDFEYSCKIGNNVFDDTRIGVMYFNLTKIEIANIMHYLNVPNEFKSFINKHNYNLLQESLLLYF